MVIQPSLMDCCCLTFHNSCVIMTSTLHGVVHYHRLGWNLSGKTLQRSKLSLSFMHALQAGVKSGATASAVVGAMNVLGTVVAASAMDKAGRKQLLRLSFGGMGLSMLAMVAGLSLSSLAHLRGSIALFGTLAYVLTFSLGAGPVPGLLVPEITPSRLRGMHPSPSVQAGHPPPPPHTHTHTHETDMLALGVCTAGLVWDGIIDALTIHYEIWKYCQSTSRVQA